MRAAALVALLYIAGWSLMGIVYVGAVLVVRIIDDWRGRHNTVVAEAEKILREQTNKEGNSK